MATEVKTTTCYMCACRCGINVHLKDGRIRYIEGNPDHPVNKGVLCAKGSAGIMQHYSPARLKSPLLRVGERGKGEFKEISWDEALELAVEKLAAVRAKDPKKLAFFTGRDQSQSLTGWWAQKFGTHNYAAHGGFCSVNMAAGGLYTIGGSFWEFGEPDWERTKYFVMWGVAEDHDSNPIKIGIGQMKARGEAKFVSVNPVRTGYSAVADEWVGIRPGTDGLLIGAIIQQLLLAEKIDWAFLQRYTNASWLVINAPGEPNHGLFARDEAGAPLSWDARVSRSAANVEAPAFTGTYTLWDGTEVIPAFQHFAEEFFKSDYDVERASELTGVPAGTIKRLASEMAHAAFEEEITLDIPWTDWTGKRHDKVTGRPVAFHAMRGISAHSNGFETCRMLHILQMVLGAIDGPGSFRYKPPFPRPIPPVKKAAQKAEGPNKPLLSEPLGFPMGPQDLAVDEHGNPTRLDKAFSWEHPLSIHGMMHMVLPNALKGDPYKIDVLFLYMANMAWNSSMNVANAVEALTAKDASGNYEIPFVIYSDAYSSETVAYADLVLPDTTYLERWDAMSILDRPIGAAHAAADSIRQPVLEVDRDVRPFQDVLIDLGARLGLPGMADDNGAPVYESYKDYLANHERAPGVGPLAGWRGEDGQSHGKGAANPDQLERYVENGCFWEYHLDESQQYYRFANKDYLETATKMGWIGSPEPIVLQLYSETMQKFRLAAEGHGINPAPEHARPRVLKYFHPIPRYYSPMEHVHSDGEAFPLSAITQRPMHMYHSWGSQNAWLRQITSRNYIYMHEDKASELDVKDGDWLWVVSEHGKVRGEVKTMTGVNPHTVWTWNAIGKRRGAWGLHRRAPEVSQSFLFNHLINETIEMEGERATNSDPITGQAAWFDVRVRIEKRRVELPLTSPMLDAVSNAENPPKDAVLHYGFDKDMGFKEQEEALEGETVNHISWQARPYVKGGDK